MAKTWVKVEKMLCFTSRTLNSLHCLFWSGSSKTLSKPSFGSHKFINGRIRSFKTQIRIVEKTRIHPDPDPKHWFTPLEFQRQTGFFLLYRLNDSFSLKWRKHFYNRKGFHEFAFAFSCFSYEKKPVLFVRPVFTKSMTMPKTCPHSRGLRRSTLFANCLAMS